MYLPLYQNILASALDLLKSRRQAGLSPYLFTSTAMFLLPPTSPTTFLSDFRIKCTPSKPRADGTEEKPRLSSPHCDRPAPQWLALLGSFVLEGSNCLLHGAPHS